MSDIDMFRERALSRIPKQLQRGDFRFVRIDSGSKRPFERQWAVPGSNTNYSIKDEKFLSWVGSHQNYGALTGAGGLCVFDADNLVRLTEIGLMKELPDTFIVRTGGGGLHLYYTTDLDQKIIMFDRELKDEGKPLHLGEVQSRGAQIVCPGSIHPNGKAYTIERDLPIASLDSVTLKSILSKYVDYGFDEAIPEKKRLKVIIVDPNIRDPFDGVRVENVLRPDKAKRSPNHIKGAHPVHGSVSGNNLIIDLKDNSWHCWRCCSGGGPALAIAVKEGIIRCDQARAGVLRGDLFKRTVEIAREKGYIGAKASNCKVEMV